MPKSKPKKRPSNCIENCRVSVFRVPTDFPESDGTIEWNSTSIVVVEVTGGGGTGLGYTYTGAGAATVISETLKPALVGMDCLDVGHAWKRMVQEVRNLGRPGLAACAISAVDVALWDLKARLLGLPLVKLLGQVRDAISLYGSGGFTSYSLQQLAHQLGTWSNNGFKQVKMKIGRDPAKDPERVKVAREAIGPGTGLFVDANGAYTPKMALARLADFEAYDVTWFEEPVSSDDLQGLKFVRQESPPRVEVAAGEYGYDLWYFRQMLESQAVDVLQADATRCGGFTGFLQAATLAEAFHQPLSAHTAPAIHLQACCAAATARNLEYFHDHVRIEGMLFEGVCRPQSGMLTPDLAQPGLGLRLKRKDAQRFEVR